MMEDFNETRSSDVYVVNFGAHYHETEHDERQFKEDVGSILIDMGKMSEVATMVWRCDSSRSKKSRLLI